MYNTEFFSLLLFFFSTGFAIGFGHCIGMCGPIVVSLSLNLKGKRLLLPHLLYHSGRIITYGLIGGVMGITGSFTALASKAAGLQKGVMIACGLMIIFMGLKMAGWLPAGSIFKEDGSLTGWFSKRFKRLMQRSSPFAYLPVGLLLGLLPCGPVYTALITVARSSMAAPSPVTAFLWGFAWMGAFGLGTVPALFLVGRLASLKWLTDRQMIYRVGAGLTVVAGIYYTIQGVRY